jgi:hypothetical protein
MTKASCVALMLSGLSGCGLVTTQAVYEEIRAQEKSKAVGTGALPPRPLPEYDTYQKERSGLSTQTP